MKNWLKLGDYNCICDSCGKKFKASSMRRRWDGLLVCEQDWEEKHPQLSLRVYADKQTVAIPRPEAEDQFINSCNLINSQGVSGFAVAGCAISGKTISGNIQ